jgi:PAS domain S-box-containing protein
VPTYELFAQGVHPDDRPLLELQLQKALRDGGNYERIHRVLWPDGTVREVHARGEVTLDDHGVAVRMIGTVQDITDRRAAEARLHAHEFVVNAIADPISVIDEHRVYSMVNDAWCRITGMTRERVEHQPPEAVQSNVGSTERNAALQRCLQDDTIQQVLVNLPMPGLGMRWWEVTIFPYHEPAWAGQQGSAKRRRAVMVTRDVTARQTAQAALAASLDNLKLTLNATGDAIFASGSRSPDEPLLFVNDRMLHMWNIPAEKAATLTASDVMAYAAPLWMNPQQEVARVREVISTNSLQEDRLLLNDGRVLLRRCIPTQLDEREVRVWGFRDITVESRALAGLRAAEAQQRDLLAAFPGYISCIDADQRYTYVN